MASINIYRIDDAKTDLFLQALAEKMRLVRTISIERQIDGNTHNFGFTLYLSHPVAERELSWQWLLNEFEQPAMHSQITPKAILYLEARDYDYAITFGNAFFTVDPYCDRDFGFSFARKHRFEGIKTTSLMTPNSRRNKTVNTYVNYDELEFDSGESFAKIKAKAQLPDDFPLFTPTLEIGTSIRISSRENSLHHIIDIIQYIESTIDSDTILYKIPVFSKVDNDLQATLEGELRASVQQNPDSINVSELDIIGVTEVFNNNDGEFVLRYGEHRDSVEQLTGETLRAFCTSHHLDMQSMLLDIQVISLKDGISVRTDRVYNLIEATNDAHRCLLSKGKWYRYNDDYLEYLRDSISEIAVEYHPEYDFSKSAHQDFIRRKSLEENIDEAAARRKYYAERYFNIAREENDGFQNHDRIDRRLGNASIELMDLYKDQTMFAVKIGSSSQKLCYVVDQSLSSMRMYKHNLLPLIPNIETVAIWLILDRTQPLPLAQNGPDLNQLNLLSLKNRLDQWKKEVRLLGYKPLIYINYLVD